MMAGGTAPSQVVPVAGLGRSLISDTRREVRSANTAQTSSESSRPPSAIRPPGPQPYGSQASTSDTPSALHRTSSRSSSRPSPAWYMRLASSKPATEQTASSHRPVWGWAANSGRMR
jgi:hypothetical protein